MSDAGHALDAYPSSWSESEYDRADVDAMPAAFARKLHEDGAIPYGYEHPDAAFADRNNGL